MSRKLALAAVAVLSAAPVPAFAREGDLRRAADEMSDPRAQRRIAGAMEEMVQAMLDMPVAPFVRATDAVAGTDKARRLPSGARLRDMAGPDASRVPHQVARAVPAMMGAMGGMAGAMEAMLPQLAAMGERMRDAVERGYRDDSRGDDGRDGDYRDEQRPDYPGDARPDVPQRSDAPAGEARPEPVANP